MTIDALVMLSGALITLFAILPRFPEPWETVLFALLGVAVIALGIVIRRRLPARESHMEERPRDMLREDAA